MKCVVPILLVATLVTVRAQVTPIEPATARSVSGQFLVHAAKSSLKPLAALIPGATNNSLTLEPSFVVISCERIKKTLLNELGASGDWRSKIFIELHPARTVDEPVTVLCNRFKDGWNYQLQMPQTVEPRRFMCAIVQTLLLELANRNASQRSAEIPAWLTQGLVQQLIESHETEFTLSPPRTAVNGIMVTRTVTQQRRADPLQNARQALREYPQLTLEQLSWPTEAQLSGEDGGVFWSSAQLFVTELLRLKGGQTCTTAMLGELPRCYNWQTAFLRAFKPHFTRLLDLEKWWALQVAHLSKRDPTRFLTLEESWRKLDEILLTAAQVRPAANELPIRTELNLQTVVAEWDFERQKRTLEGKVRSLDFLRPRIAPELVALVGDYRQLLDNYLKTRAKAAFNLPGARSLVPATKSVVRETVKQLQLLDEKRMAVKPQPAQASVQ